MRTVEELLALAPGRFEITVFGAEPHPNYDRIMLSPLLAGTKRFADIIINDHAWYKENGIRLIAGEHADWIDRKERIVHGAAGSAVPYDLVLLATGSNPIALPIPGSELRQRPHLPQRCRCRGDAGNRWAWLPRGGDRRRAAGARSGARAELRGAQVP